MFYEINFVIDTGYIQEYCVCIVVADNEENAKENFYNWILPKLRGEEFVVDDKIEITLKHKTEHGIIYQSYFEKD